MKTKKLLFKTSIILTLIIAAFHTFFILIGGPEFPDTEEFKTMQHLMRTIQIDAGGVTRTMQNFIDGFNIVASIFLFTLPLLSLFLLPEIAENRQAINKLIILYLTAMAIFCFNSFLLLALGGTILSGIISITLILSLVSKN